MSELENCCSAECRSCCWSYVKTITWWFYIVWVVVFSKAMVDGALYFNTLGELLMRLGWEDRPAFRYEEPYDMLWMPLVILFTLSIVLATSVSYHKFSRRLWEKCVDSRANVAAHARTASTDMETGEGDEGGLAVRSGGGRWSMSKFACLAVFLVGAIYKALVAQSSFIALVFSIFRALPHAETEHQLSLNLQYLFIVAPPKIITEFALFYMGSTIESRRDEEENEGWYICVAGAAALAKSLAKALSLALFFARFFTVPIGFWIIFGGVGFFALVFNIPIEFSIFSSGSCGQCFDINGPWRYLIGVLFLITSFISAMSCAALYFVSLDGFPKHMSWTEHAMTDDWQGYSGCVNVFNLFFASCMFVAQFNLAWARLNKSYCKPRSVDDVSSSSAENGCCLFCVKSSCSRPSFSDPIDAVRSGEWEHVI